MLTSMASHVDDDEVIRECLRAAVDGPFFPDWEFATLFGFERGEIRNIAERWPEWDDAGEQSDAVNNTLNHLLGYPINQRERWTDYISVSPNDVIRVYARWRGEDEIDLSGEGYFDRLR